MKENDPPIPVAKIDATSESALAGRFGVSGYPTIKILKKGQAVDYEGSRTQEGEWSLHSWRRVGQASLFKRKLREVVWIIGQVEWAGSGPRSTSFWQCSLLEHSR